MKLFPLLAQSYAMALSHKYVLDKYQRLMEDVKKGEFGLLDELHHFTSGMKSVFTQSSFDGLLQIR